MNIALVLSGGVGSRLEASLPKQYIEIGKRPIISYCIERLSEHDLIDALWIVADAMWHTQIKEWLKTYDVKNKFKGFSEPGKNRQLSILHGLEEIRRHAEGSDYVMIHDAVRPLTSVALISNCFAALPGHGGVIPVLPVKDTVYYSRDGKSITSLLDRNCIYAGQSPEVFRLGEYYEANMRLMPNRILKINGSTEPAVMAGMDIAMIPGDEDNFKITTRADLVRFRQKIGENDTDIKGETDESNGIT